MHTGSNIYTKRKLMVLGPGAAVIRARPAIFIYVGMCTSCCSLLVYQVRESLSETRTQY